jgi:16S rRNA (cytosine967-C5)-methyltransferase
VDDEAATIRRPAKTHSQPKRSEPGPVIHVAPLELLARSTAEIAERVEHAVVQGHRRADRVLSAVLRNHRQLAPPDQRFVSQAVFAWFRWRGWLEPLGLRSIETRLLLATLLDSSSVSPVCRVWAREAGRDPSSLFPLGDAPNWPARAEGFRRLLGGRPVTADPWRLFPPWLREHLPLPPGGGAAKTRFMELLQTLQKRAPLWVRAQTADPRATWSELKSLGVRPWIHRRIASAAKLEPDVDVYHLTPFLRGELEIQDLASQAVGLVCQPDPGERWWDACAGAGGKSLHLAALMRAKGVVVASDIHEHKLKETVRRARRSPFRNVTTRIWDGRHVAGKPASFDGVLVDAPCSGIGTWRRNPDARWTVDRAAIPRLAELQRKILDGAAAGVKTGGALVYSVCTLTPAETHGVVREFLEAHANFRLDPFAQPLTGAMTDGTVTIWPHDADTDAMFIARMIRVS